MRPLVQPVSAASGYLLGGAVTADENPSSEALGGDRLGVSTTAPQKRSKPDP